LKFQLPLKAKGINSALNPLSSKGEIRIVVEEKVVIKEVIKEIEIIKIVEVEKAGFFARLIAFIKGLFT